MAENPFGNTASLSEYSDRYLKELDKFLEEARRNGVWFFSGVPINADTPDWTIMTFGYTKDNEIQTYMPLWSNPADGLSLAMHIEGPELQSVPFDLFANSIMENPRPGVVAAINPVVRNGKPKPNGETPIGIIPPVLIPFNILLAIYRGDNATTFSTELTGWIVRSKTAVYDF